MGVAKKLDLPLEKLIEIASAINENTIANRIKQKEDKISTDKFITKFGINRKSYSASIKDTEIRYNSSTFLYDISGETVVKSKSETVVSLNKNKDKEENYTTKKLNSESFVVKSETEINLANKQNNESEVIVLPQGETFVSLNETALAHFDKRINSIEEMRYDIEEMMEWYRAQKKKENIIDVEIPEIKIDKDCLNEEPSTRGFKIYPSVVAKFKEFCKVNSQYTMQDLMAMAMIEYIDKYKK
jgi:hypothetical protein